MYNVLNKAAVFGVKLKTDFNNNKDKIFYLVKNYLFNLISTSTYIYN